MGLCDIGSSAADAIGTHCLCTSAVLPSPREASRNDTLTYVTSVIVTGRLPPVRAETRATAHRRAKRLVVAAPVRS